MSAGQPSPGDERGFDAASWVVLGAAVLAVAFWLIQPVWRLSLPSDGWATNLDENRTDPQIVFVDNQTDLPSPLRPGDVLVAVEGQPIDLLLARALTPNPARPSHWRAGQTVRYTVNREGRDLDLDVPLSLRPWSAIPHTWRSKAVEIGLMLLILLLPGLVFFLRPRNPAARIMFLFSALLAGMALSPVGYGPAELFYPAAYWTTYALDDLVWMCFIGPVWVHLFLVFPVTKGLVRRHPRLTLAVVYGSTPAAFLIALWLSDDWARGFWPTLRAASLAQSVLGLTAIALIVGHTFLTLRDPVGRAQMRWFATGFLVAVGGATVSYQVGMWVLPDSFGLLDALGGLFFLALPVSLAIAILRYRLFDIDVIINRTLVYALLTGALAAVYFGSVVLLQASFRAVVGQESDLAIVAATLAVAALFQPLRGRLQTVIDRRFYRRRYHAATTLAVYGKALQDDADIERVSAGLLGVVRETVQPAHASLWLRQEEPAHPRAARPGAEGRP